MAWAIEHTDEFEAWWDGLSVGEQEDVAARVGQLEQVGPSLGRPAVGTIERSRHPNMKELVIQHAGDPYRVFFVFDPRRIGIMLIGGNKTGDDRFYERMVPIADALYDAYLAELAAEGLIQ